MTAVEVDGFEERRLVTATLGDDGQFEEHVVEGVEEGFEVEGGRASAVGWVVPYGWYSS